MAVAEGRRRQLKSPSLRTIAVTIERALFDQIEELAQQSGLSRSATVSQLIRAGLEDRIRAA